MTPEYGLSLLFLVVDHLSFLGFPWREIGRQEKKKKSRDELGLSMSCLQTPFLVDFHQARFQDKVSIVSFVKGIMVVLSSSSRKPNTRMEREKKKNGDRTRW